MRFEILRKDQLVMNKVNGNVYRVLDGGKAVMLKDDEPVAGSEITITEKNAIAFRLLLDPNMEPIPDTDSYTVKDGILLKDDEPVTEQGQLYIESILGTISGLLVLAVRAKTGEERIDIFTYNPAKDTFKKVVSSSFPVNNVDSVVRTDNTIVLYAYETAEEEIEDENEDGKKKTVQVLKKSTLISISSGEKGRDIKVETADFNILFATMSPEIIGTDQFFIMKSVSKADVNGELKSTDPKYLIHDLSLNWITNFEAKEELTSVAISNAYPQNAFSAQTKGSVIILDSNKCPLTISGASLPAGYDYLVDITNEDHVTRISFANAAYDIKTVVSKNTKDRGFIVTVE